MGYHWFNGMNIPLGATLSCINLGTMILVHWLSQVMQNTYTRKAMVGISPMGCSRKNPNMGGWGHGISIGIVERTCVNSCGQFKKKWNFYGRSIKNHVEFPWVLVLQNFQEWSFVFPEISKGKLTNLKIPGTFFKNYVHNRSSRPEVFYKKVFWKCTTHLQKNSHAEGWSCFATLLKSRFGMGVLL